MSQQPLDLRRSLQIVRRYWVLVGVVAGIGLLAGAAFALVNPPMLASQAVVVLSPSMHETRTQAVIASSDPVLVPVLRKVDRGLSLQALRNRINVRSLAYNVLSISANGKTAVQAETTSNAVADSYVHYLASGTMPGGAVQTRVLAPATAATGASLPTHMLGMGALGALAGLLLGSVTALALGRSNRRLRERDDIAESIGVPVLASISVHRPSDTAGWKKLLEDYEPEPVDAWRLRKTLQYLELASGPGSDSGSGASIAVLSLTSDSKALAIGPQLAVFAASLGIPTALVISPQHDTGVTATLRAACAATVPSHLRGLRVILSDQDGSERLPGAALTVVVAVINGQSPEVAAATPTVATVVGVSAGAATAEQLARVAASAAAAGRDIAGILVADPDPDDHTTGRIPQLVGPARRFPTHDTETTTEMKR